MDNLYQKFNEENNLKTQNININAFDLAKDVFAKISLDCSVINDDSNQGFVKKQNYIHLKKIFDLCEQINEKNASGIFTDELNKLLEIFFESIPSEYKHLIDEYKSNQISARE